jgi:hypothetical protein
MPARHKSLQDDLLCSKFKSDGSGRRKRVSARHQVKRLDQSFEELSALSKTGLAEETGFLRSVRILISAISPAVFAQVKSGPDVFADALVPQSRCIWCLALSISQIS